MASLEPPFRGQQTELRDDARRRVGRVPLGQVVIRDRLHVQTVLEIRDLSSRGVSLCVEGELSPGEPVVLELRRGAQQMAFYGYVAWCRSSSSLDHDIGADFSVGHAEGHIVGLRMVGSPSMEPLARR